MAHGGFPWLAGIQSYNLARSAFDLNALPDDSAPDDLLLMFR